LVVVEVPGGGAFVAVLVCDAVLELVVGVLVTVVVVVVVGCVDVEELVLADEEDFVADAQSLAASCSTVWAPSPRFCTSLVLTDGGRWPTAVLKALAALVAAEQSPELTAFETASSRLESVLP
jgi:hypothetical protein